MRLTGSCLAVGLATWWTVAVAGAAPGDLDGGFGDAGIVLTHVTDRSDSGNAIAVQPDGKLVVAGTTDQYWSALDVIVIRYLPDGTIDQSFGNDGSMIVSIGTWDDYATAVAVRPDGKIVVGGYWLAGAHYQIGVIRLLPGGTLDPTFGVNGIARADIGPNHDLARALVLQPDGKIVTAGESWTGVRYAVAHVRFLDDGSLDPTFGTNGSTVGPVLDQNVVAYAEALQADGALVAGGFVYGATGMQWLVVRHFADGTLDTGFGNGGVVTADLGSGDESVRSIVIQPDGKIVTAGYVDLGEGSGKDFALVRLLPDGSFDPTFGENGRAITALGSADDIATTVLLQADGKLVVAGSTFTDTYEDVALARYTANGALDATFGTNGVVHRNIGLNRDGAEGAALQTDQKIVVTGYAVAPPGPWADIALARFDGDPPPRCGDGHVDAGEECDDGNTDAGDGCDPTCLLEPCAPTPATGCRAPVGGSTGLRAKGSADARAIRWRWLGSAMPIAELGDPLGTDAYVWCLYDDGALVATTPISATTGCDSRPCWRKIRDGFRFKASQRAGVQTLKLAVAPNRKTQLDLKARAVALRGIAGAPLHGPVVAQLKRVPDGPCWTATYSAPFTANVPTAFVDRAD